MEYIATSNNKAINSTPQILVVEVKDTDELIDRNNVEYIQNANLMNVSLNGDYQVISEDEAAEVNDMLQYWGSIHMFGTEIVPIATTALNNKNENIYFLRLYSMLNDQLNIDEDVFTDSELESIEYNCSYWIEKLI